MLQNFHVVPQGPPHADNPTAAESQETLHGPDPDKPTHANLTQINEAVVVIDQSTDIDPSSLAFNDEPQSQEEAQHSLDHL